MQTYHLWYAAGIDYVVRDPLSQYTIQPKEEELTIDIEIRNDDIVEGTEYFNVVLQNVVGALVEPERSLAQVQIHDNDRKWPLCYY